MRKIYVINSLSNSDSNMFLRCLWSMLRNDDKSGWHINPMKDKSLKQLFIGRFTSTILQECYSIFVTYKIKGCVKSIIFETSNQKPIPLMDMSFIDNCIEKSKNYQELYTQNWMLASVCSKHNKLSNYKAFNFMIASTRQKKHYNVAVNVAGFDKVDIETEFLKKMHIITDVLSSVTNDVFLLNNKIVDDKINFDFDNLFFPEDKVISDESYLLSKQIIDGLSLLLEDNVTDDYQRLINAARVFHQAKKYCLIDLDLEIKQLFLPNFEIANALYMSSLEILSLIENKQVENCKECGQPMHSIRKRVLYIVEKYSDSQYMKKIIDSYYKSRSSFVHEGMLFSNNSYNKTSIPQINNTNDFVSQMSMDTLVGLSDLISEIMDKLFSELFVNFT